MYTTKYTHLRKKETLLYFTLLIGLGVSYDRKHTDSEYLERDSVHHRRLPMMRNQHTGGMLLVLHLVILLSF